MELQEKLSKINIIIIIISQELGLNRPVSASSDNLLKGLPSRFFHLVHISALRLLSCCSFFVYRNKFDVHRLRFSSSGSTFNYSKIASFLLWSKIVYPSMLLKNFISFDVNHFYPFVMRFKFSLQYRRMAIALYTFILEYFWAKVGLKLLFKILSI